MLGFSLVVCGEWSVSNGVTATLHFGDQPAAGVGHHLKANVTGLSHEAFRCLISVSLSHARVGFAGGWWTPENTTVMKRFLYLSSDAAFGHCRINE